MKSDVSTLSSERNVLGNGTDVGLGPLILLDIEILSNAVIMSSLLDEISVGLTSPKTVKKKFFFKNLDILLFLKRARVIVAWPVS